MARDVKMEKPIPMFDQAGKPALTREGKQALYCTAHFMAEFVFPDKRWRDEWASSFTMLAEKFSVASVAKASRGAGAMRVPDTEFDRVKAVLKNVDLSQQQLAILTPLMPFFHAWTLAPFVDDGASGKPKALKSQR